MIGAGAVVVHNIKESGVYIGIPAKEKIMSKPRLTGGGILLFKKENWKKSLDYQKQNRRVAA